MTSLLKLAVGKRQMGLGMWKKWGSPQRSSNREKRKGCNCCCELSMKMEFSTKEVKHYVTCNCVIFRRSGVKAEGGRICPTFHLWQRRRKYDGKSFLLLASSNIIILHITVFIGIYLARLRFKMHQISRAHRL